MNQQEIEKAVSSLDGSVEVHSIFHTIQGEGPFCGTPAIFIRLSGCNLRCPECDTDYTSNRQRMPVNTILQRCVNFSTKGLIVITGGEPFRQQIGSLVNTLVGFGYYVQVETNGTLPPSSDVMWQKITSSRNGAYIVCSPKAGRLNSRIEKEACCFKYVVTYNEIREDGLPENVLGHSSTPFVARPLNLKERIIYIQPSDLKNETQNKKNMEEAVRSCMKHGYTLQLQIHKIIGAE